MKVLRQTEIETNEFRVGDQIRVGRYTATCQKTAEDGALFLLDQYLDESMQMNEDDANEGSYMASDLRKRLNSDDVLDIFKELRDRMVPLNDRDLLRIPFYGEMFGHDAWYNSGAVEPDDCKQWPLMKKRANRIAERTGERYEWGWLRNKFVQSAPSFCNVTAAGYANNGNASASIGVRPAFLIK